MDKLMSEGQNGGYEVGEWPEEKTCRPPGQWVQVVRFDERVTAWYVDQYSGKVVTLFTWPGPWLHDAWVSLIAHDRVRWAMVEKPSIKELAYGGRPKVLEQDEEIKTVAEMMTHSYYSDGSTRELSTVSISYSDGMFKGCLRDKDNERCLWVASERLSEVIYTIEAVLTSTNPEWRKDRYMGDNKDAGKVRKKI